MSNISKVKLLSERIQRKYKWKCQWFYFHFQILLRSAYIIKRESWAGTVEDCEGFGGDVGAAGEDHCHDEEEQGHQEHYHHKGNLCLNVIQT